MRPIRLASIDDPRIAEYRAVRDPELAPRLGIFVAESRLVVERVMVASRFRVRSLLLTDAACAALPAAAAEARPDVPAYICTAAQMSAVSGFDLHQGCLALAERPEAASADDVIGNARTIVVLEAVSNPDNVGAVFRDAAAFGVDAILMSPTCADPFYRKAIRTSMAATLSVPFARLDVWPADLQLVKSAGFDIVALSPRPTAPALDTTLRAIGGSRVALLAGSEGHGLTLEAAGQADHQARIPMALGIDSLNVSVAVAVALYGLRSMTRGTEG